MIESSGDSRPAAELLVLGASEVVTAPLRAGPARPDPAEIGAIAGGAVAVAGGRILWVGHRDEIEDAVRRTPETVVIRADGCLVTPGLVDPHTHLVHAGERADEFHLRNRGASYATIAAAGGGILSTVRSTRAATEEELVELALPRLSRMLSQGVTCCEVKSGYGLGLEDELKILRVVKTLQRLQPLRLVPTFLGAHSIPLEYRGRRKDYLDLVVGEMIPAVVEQGLACACDVFCEQGVFDLEESRRVLQAAKEAGLDLHMHAEQFEAFGGALLAAELGALSADHLEAVEIEGARALAKARVVAVGLPGCNLFLDQQARMPARMLIDAGVRVALATDFNPGTCNTLSLPLIMTLGCARLKLSPAECMAAVTCEAARALGLQEEIGSLQPGLRADLAAFPVPSHHHLPYCFGTTEASWVVVRGQQVYANPRVGSWPAPATVAA